MRKGININCEYFRAYGKCSIRPRYFESWMAKCTLAKDSTKYCTAQTKHPKPPPPPSPPPKRILSEDVGYKDKWCVCDKCGQSHKIN